MSNKTVSFAFSFLRKGMRKNLSTMSDSYPTNLAGFGYGFNEDGELKQLDKESGKLTDKGFEFVDQDHYEALGEVITEHVYNLLEENGMHKVFINDDVPKEQSPFIFMSKKELDHPKKLLVLIHGSGVVRAGQWARSLIINQSLSHGTQIPYLEKARELNYDVLIANTNDNYRSINGVERQIKGHGSPEEHGYSIWEKYVIASNPESVGIVAHSYGGVVTLRLAKKYPKFFKEKVFAVGLTDSVHSRTSSQDPDVFAHLKKIGRNWVTSNKPLNQCISESSNDIPQYSAGHVKHEWTSYSCITALFDFFEEKYNEFLTKK
ncbi:FAM172 family protein homolog CG10038 [Condylostylus longicornis]|uniref:FAM172 family protein homolog CG10038 n=1 Tax=Condylostylus longicornis TaxID=2530218 RepID=UPI00244E17CD|nr:FAM172 family protein homolog CG10038 [Condylostylus longicornis]